MLHCEVKRLAGRTNTLLAELLAHLAEVEARGIHRERACASLYTYCVYELRMSEDEAQRRCRAARLARQFPALLSMLAEASIHLTGILLIGPHLTPENHEQWLARVRFRTKREIERLVAELAPAPDAPARIEPLHAGMPSSKRRSSTARLPLDPEAPGRPMCAASRARFESCEPASAQGKRRQRPIRNRAPTSRPDLRRASPMLSRCSSRLRKRQRPRTPALATECSSLRIKRTSTCSRKPETSCNTASPIATWSKSSAAHCKRWSRSCAPESSLLASDLACPRRQCQRTLAGWSQPAWNLQTRRTALTTSPGRTTPRRRGATYRLQCAALSGSAMPLAAAMSTRAASAAANAAGWSSTISSPTPAAARTPSTT